MKVASKMPMKSLAKIRIILLETTHPGNIGAVARAMKTMNLLELCLVNPKCAFPTVESTVRAAGADNILEHATLVNSLDKGLAGCQLIMGTSARNRRLSLPLHEPHQAARFAMSKIKNNKIAVLFGREHAGLTNAELNRCHYHINIPSNPDYNSLNLAAAVQIICYELRITFLSQTAFKTTEPLATDQEKQLFYRKLEQTLCNINFLRESNPCKIMPRLQRLFNRAQLEKMEFDMLMGILKAMNQQYD